MTPIEEMQKVCDSMDECANKYILQDAINELEEQIEAKVKEAVEEKENDIIGFAEWLTEKHTLTLIELYKIYNKEYKK